MAASINRSISPDPVTDSVDSGAEAACFELDVAKVAPLVADGEVAWPDDLTNAQVAALTVAVRNLNRTRLIKLVARLLAADIACEQASEIDHE